MELMMSSRTNGQCHWDDPFWAVDSLKGMQYSWCHHTSQCVMAGLWGYVSLGSNAVIVPIPVPQDASPCGHVAPMVLSDTCRDILSLGHSPWRTHGTHNAIMYQ